AETGADDGVSLRAVARRVGIAAPSVYLHFASKDALVQAVVDEQFIALRQAVEAALAEETEPAAQLLAGCLAYCRFALERPGPYRILFGSSRRSQARPESGATTGEAAFATLVDTLAACMATGAAPPGDPFRIAVDVWPALHGMVSLRRSLPEFSWPPLAEQVQGVLERLVGVTFGPAAPAGVAAGGAAGYTPSG
ncbi:MAG TPA: TetR/AcrR family transcriptional regulator, partial [Thermomicrobiales bacterium]|nr:TetR/AcrR family transcriptional regulator [Thermomicrobiales bacterium]